MSQADYDYLPMETQGIPDTELSPGASGRDPDRPEDVESSRRNLSPGEESPAGRLRQRHTGLQGLSFARLTSVSSGPTMVAVAKPVRPLGEFFAMSLDTFVMMFRPPFAWREFLSQCWFVARVTWLSALLMTLPYSVILTFITNILLTDIGAGDFSGAGASLFTVTQIGPLVTVLVISGGAATAMCADLGARTIREELDALRVMGIDPIRALVVPRVLAMTIVGCLEVQLVSTVSMVGSFLFTVFIQHVSAGAFVAGMPTLTHLGDIIVSAIKGALFGGLAGMIACYRGISVGGGPAGVGNAVNETVVFAFMTLFAVNIVVTAVGTAINLS